MGKTFLYGRLSIVDRYTPYAKLTVHCPAGVIVRISSDQSSIVRESTSNGQVIFEDLTEGVWEITYTNVEHALASTIQIDDLRNEITLELFEAYVNVKYPEGADCILTDGLVTFSAPDTSGSWICNLDEKGSWTVTATRPHALLGMQTASSTVSISATGQQELVKLQFFESYINVEFPYGSTCQISNGSEIYTAPTSSGYYSFIVPHAGTWNVTISDGTYSKTESVDIIASGVFRNIRLNYGVIVYSSVESLMLSEPADGTIGVVADVDSNEWSITANEPETVNNYHLWIIVNGEGAPIAVKQYLNSAWVSVNAMLRQNGTWVGLPGGYFYHNGDEYAALTGGWSDYGTAAGSIIKSGDAIEFDWAGSEDNDTFRVLHTNATIDLDNSSYITFDINDLERSDTGVYFFVGICKTIPSEYYQTNILDGYVQYDAVGNVQITLDTSAYSGQHYIVVYGNFANQANCYIRGRITEVRMQC